MKICEFEQQVEAQLDTLVELNKETPCCPLGLFTRPETHLPYPSHPLIARLDLPDTYALGVATGWDKCPLALYADSANYRMGKEFGAKMVRLVEARSHE